MIRTNAPLLDPPPPLAVSARRVCLLGPVTPFRGGVAQHTTMLHHTLRKRSELLTLSFARQYPQWLFPGRSGTEAPGEDVRLDDVQYQIDSLNPFTWLQACRQIDRFAPDVVVIPWWTAFWGPWTEVATRHLKRQEIPFVFLCHNVLDHEASWLRSLLTRRVLKQGRSFVTQSLADAAALRTLVPEAYIRTHPHPVFSQFPEPDRTLPRKAALELLFFGLVRPYKGLDVLAEALELLPPELDVHLRVVGEWWLEDNELHERLAQQERVEVIDRYVSRAEAAAYFTRADAVVLPYRAASGTGVIPLAYRYGKPVLATRVGGLPDVVQDDTSGWLTAPDDPVALADAIRTRVARHAEYAAIGARDLADQFTWDSLADCLLEAAAAGTARPLRRPAS